VTIDAGMIAAARAAIAPYLDRTPMVRIDAVGAPERTIYLKDETVLPTGSFKVRGAIYALKAACSGGIVTEAVAASTGNHGAAVAYAARLLGVSARIFLPEHPNPVKAGRIRELGAVLVETGSDLTDAIDAAEEYVTSAGAFFLHDASSLEVPAGAATIGAEILEDVPDVDEVYVPMGDTALIRGVASALRLGSRRIRIVGVVAEAAPAYYLSWKSGQVTETATADTIADGLAVRRPLASNVAAIRALVDDVVSVSEREMLQAITRVRAATGILAEPSGAAAVAAVIAGRPAGVGGAAGRAVPVTVALVTGGNISPEVERQLAI
jgi:threonine dehydratase